MVSTGGEVSTSHLLFEPILPESHSIISMFPDGTWDMTPPLFVYIPVLPEKLQVPLQQRYSHAYLYSASTLVQR